MDIKIIFATDDIFNNWSEYDTMNSNNIRDINNIIIRIGKSEKILTKIDNSNIYDLPTIRIIKIPKYIYISIDAKYIPLLLNSISPFEEPSTILDYINSLEDFNTLYLIYNGHITQKINNKKTKNQDNNILHILDEDRIKTYHSVVEIPTFNENDFLRRINHAKDIMRNDFHDPHMFNSIFRQSLIVKIKHEDLNEFLKFFVQSPCIIVHYDEYEEFVFFIISATIKEYEDIIYKTLYGDKHSTIKMKFMVQQIDQILAIFNMRG